MSKKRCLGIRTFSPQPVCRLLESVGGISSLLGLVAMAKDSEGLYASVKALLCVIRNNNTIAKQMNVNRGYQVLLFLPSMYVVLQHFSSNSYSFLLN